MATKAQFERQLQPRFIGITRAAKELKVTTFHLREFLKGNRKSERLAVQVKRRYPGLLGITKM